MIFRYRGRDPLGRVVEGELDCRTQDECVAELRGRALEPLWIRPVVAPAQTRAEPLHPLTLEQAAPIAQPTETGDEPDPAGAEKRSGCSVWTILFILYMLFQVFRRWL